MVSAPTMTVSDARPFLVGRVEAAVLFLPRRGSYSQLSKDMAEMSCSTL